MIKDGSENFDFLETTQKFSRDLKTLGFSYYFFLFLVPIEIFTLCADCLPDRADFKIY